MATIMEDEKEIKSMPLKKENFVDETQVIILLEKNTNFKDNLKTYEVKICGKKMWEWVKLACDGFEIKTTSCTEESDILTLIKPLLGNFKTTLVLFSSTPLIERKTINEILDYVKIYQPNVLKLDKGYVFNTQYIKDVDSFSDGNLKSFGDKDFFEVNSAKNLLIASDIIKNRIIAFHVGNGVKIFDAKTVFIDADVVIESGVEIYPLCTLQGKCYIAKNCKIESGSYIENSIIKENTIIRQSRVYGSKICANKIVGPFENIENMLAN